jgi:hypothetical protein
MLLGGFVLVDYLLGCVPAPFHDESPAHSGRMSTLIHPVAIPGTILV